MVLVKPGRIGPKFAPQMVRLPLPGLFCCRTLLLQLFHSFIQLHGNGFALVNNSFQGGTRVGGAYAVEYQ